jgi:hypothetical protein
MHPPAEGSVADLPGHAQVDVCWSAAQQHCWPVHVQSSLHLLSTVQAQSLPQPHESLQAHSPTHVQPALQR